MADEVKARQSALRAQVEELLNQHPALKQALEVFDLSVAQYEKALASLRTVQTTTSNMTTQG